MIYLDHAATTPCHPQVIEAMLPMFREEFGNASSPHALGRAALRRVDEARAAVAHTLNVAPTQVIWTSGATEAINTAIHGLPGSGRLVTSAVDHKAVLDAADATGPVTRLQTGHVLAPEAVAAEIAKGDVRMVAAIAVNNETGAIADIRGLAETCAPAGVPLLLDTTQAVGKIPLDLGSLPGAVFATVSAHKIFGPQGVGALILPTKAVRPTLQPLIHGGGHQSGYRSGTYNLPGIVGLARAMELIDLPLSTSHAEACRSSFIEGLAGLTGVLDNTEGARVPHILNLSFDGVDGDALVTRCGGIALATGSACNSDLPVPSHVLTALVGQVRASSSVRVSFGASCSPSDAYTAATEVRDQVEQLRELVR